MLDWFQLANNKENKTIQLRRYLHQYPELSFEEFQTHDYIVNQLSQLSCDIETPIGRNGIKATFKGLGTGPTIALRADFDALPVEELNDVPYKSKNPGCMHACGHDGHTAILLTVAEFILSAQKIISRTIDPVKQAVLSFGMIQAGTTDSVIPDQAFCKGTVRTFDSDIQNHVMDKMDKLLQGLAIANDINYDLNYIKGYLPVHNNEKAYQVIKEATNDLHVRFNESDLMMIGEDFSHYLKVRPGAFFLTGCGNESKGITAPHHNPKFDIDEKSLKYAVAVFLKIIELEQVFKTN
ncbi:TPA: M20/M25/M40 family metallo-hydrolase [Staphylococcus aureus]